MLAEAELCDIQLANLSAIIAGKIVFLCKYFNLPILET